MATTTTSPAHTITTEIDKKHRTVTVHVLFPASEHLDRHGVTAWYGVQLTTKFHTPGYPYGVRRYETSYRDIEVNADGYANIEVLPDHRNRLPFGGSIHVDADRYNARHLEEVADQFTATAITDAALTALETWATRHATYLAENGR